MSTLAFVGTVAGGAAGGPGGAATGNALGNILSNWFGGSRDAQRQARVDWFKTQALAGSVIAARVIIGGPANVASNEDPMWVAALEAIKAARPDVYNAAFNAGGPLWDSTDNETSDKMRAAVNGELATLSSSSPPPAQSWSALPGDQYAPPIPASSAGQSGGGVLLPGMTTTASRPTSINPLYIVGALLGVALLVGLLKGRS